METIANAVVILCVWIAGVWWGQTRTIQLLKRHGDLSPLWRRDGRR